MKKKVSGATKRKLSQLAQRRVRGKSGRFAMSLESDKQRELSWESIIGVAILVTIVVVLTIAVGK